MGCFSCFDLNSGRCSKAFLQALLVGTGGCGDVDFIRAPTDSLHGVVGKSLYTSFTEIRRQGMVAGGRFGCGHDSIRFDQAICTRLPSSLY